MEYFDDQQITYKISDPKKAEWILSKSIKNSKLVGNGSANVDIKVNDNTSEGEKAVEIFRNKFNEKYSFKNEKRDIYYMIFICVNHNIYIYHV